MEADKEEADGFDSAAVAALALGAIAFVSFLVALFLANDPFLFLAVALLCGILSFVFTLRARRAETAAIALGAGAAVLYGVTLLALLTAMMYAMGVMMLILLLFFMFFASQPSSGGGGCGSSGPRDPCCCGDCCGTGTGSCCECGSCCDCGGCDCGGCGGCGCGGCGCIGLGLVPALVANAPRLGLAGLLARGMPHHPDTPTYREDVYVVRGARWCIGCFTTYPVFLLASALLILAAPPALAWTSALTLGASLASAQLVSSAGFARRWWMKALVKASLGLGLALLLVGVHGAPWHVAWKVGALAGILLLAWLSAIPRARRMRRERAARCAQGLEGDGCATATPRAR